MFKPTHLQFYQDNGYVVVEGLFSQAEAAQYRDHIEKRIRRVPKQKLTANWGSVRHLVNHVQRGEVWDQVGCPRRQPVGCAVRHCGKTSEVFGEAADYKK